MIFTHADWGTNLNGWRLANKRIIRIMRASNEDKPGDKKRSDDIFVPGYFEERLTPSIYIPMEKFKLGFRGLKGVTNRQFFLLGWRMYEWERS